VSRLIGGHPQTPGPIDRADALEQVLSIAREASRRILAIYGRGPVAVEYKGKDDPVTIADREANAILCRRLGEAYPGVPIVAEESDPTSFAGWAGAPVVWFVDPLDGTREFIAQNGEFAVMVGLAEEGRATLGVVVCPALGRDFVGAAGIGAFEVDETGARRTVHVSSVATLREAELVVSRSHRVASVEELAAQMGVRKITPCGSAGVKGVRIAAGEADIYSQTGLAGKRWDSCAPEAIVAAAGGTVTDDLGRPFEYASGELANDHGFIATNGLVHAAVLERIRDERAKRGG
jgi:3'(2'), 5'-bisphosphate nucleotidase